jgi:hypothetical protein
MFKLQILNLLCDPNDFVIFAQLCIWAYTPAYAVDTWMYTPGGG